MRMRILSLSFVLLSLSLLQGRAAWAVEVVVHTQSNRYEADLNSHTLSVANSAQIHVIVTDAGVGVGTLGSTAGNGTAAISLPAGWLFAATSAPPAGCGFTPTEFINGGIGGYIIRVVPTQSNPSCVWKAGEYVYYIRIDTASYQGWALGKLIVN